MARVRGYSRLQIGLHWAVVLMVAVQILIADNMTEMVDAQADGKSVDPQTSFFGMLHYWLGIAILAVILVRRGVRLTRGVPSHAGQQNALQSTAAAALHWLFYVILIAVPVSGLIAYYGIADIGDLHAKAKPVLLVLVSLHVLAALYNQFVRKDGTLERMTRPSSS